jgi:transitional endoplasmic reticulum ATPase
LLAKAVANESEASFFSISGPEIMGSHHGESEQRLRDIVQDASRRAPSIIFIDEIDSLVPARGGGLGEPPVTERGVHTIRAEREGREEVRGVVGIGATNRPNLLDPALFRPGRFDELVYVPVPDEAGREQSLRIQTQGMPLAGDVDLAEIARRTHGYTGADLGDVVRRAGLSALRQDLATPAVRQAEFEKALSESRASVTAEMEQQYEELRTSLKRQAPMQRRRIGFEIDGT